VVNKARPMSAAPTDKPKAAPAAAKPVKTAAPKKTQPAQPIQISTGNAELDKKYGVGQTTTLPTEIQSKTASDRIGTVYAAGVDVDTQWEQVARFYGFSVVPLIKELVLEGVWPNKETADAKGNKKQVPQSYKEVYNTEKEAKMVAIGHWVNRASERFSHYKPEQLKRKATATTQSGKRTIAKRQQSGLERAKEFIAGLTDAEIKELIADEFVNAALKPYLKPEYILKAK